MVNLLQKNAVLQQFASDYCLHCQTFHSFTEHPLAEMPKNLSDFVQDCVKMGLYPGETLEVAHRIVSKKFRELLLVASITQQDEEKRQVYQELIQQAGGLEAALAAAFGNQSEVFFQDVLTKKSFSRREFLKQVVIVASLISLANCSNNLPETEENLTFNSKLEKTHLRIGFIPITCATPIIMSAPLGFYQKQGLTVELVKMKSWIQVRDSAMAGELDAYHMLSPMPLAMTLGLGSPAFPIKLASIENINGNAITLAKKYQGKVKKVSDFKGFRISVPFPFSMPNLLMRYYLAAGKLNPDQDVEFVFMPPMQMVEELGSGKIDAMMVAEPYNQIAVAQNVGFIYLLTQELWPGHPCCAFATGQPWIEAHPNTFRAVNKAIIDGANYARQPSNRKQVAQVISPPEYLDTPEDILLAVLTGKFDDGLGNIRNVPDRIDFDPYPWKSFSYWITSQLVRWQFISSEKVDHEVIADQVFLTGLARQLAKQLGQTPPSLILREEVLKYETFDPSEPEQYIENQIKKYGR